MLTEIASHRLAARGRSLERLSDQDGRELLGEGLWDIVRPDRPFPSDRNARGVSSHELDAMLAVLERLWAARFRPGFQHRSPWSACGRWGRS
jgi:hypothetical protein